jgi:hypothetical protein
VLWNTIVAQSITSRKTMTAPITPATTERDDDDDDDDVGNSEAVVVSGEVQVEKVLLALCRGVSESVGHFIPSVVPGSKSGTNFIVLLQTLG